MVMQGGIFVQFQENPIFDIANQLDYAGLNCQCSLRRRQTQLKSLLVCISFNNQNFSCITGLERLWWTSKIQSARDVQMMFYDLYSLICRKLKKIGQCYHSKLYWRPKTFKKFMKKSFVSPTRWFRQFVTEVHAQRDNQHNFFGSVTETLGVF